MRGLNQSERISGTKWNDRKRCDVDMRGHQMYKQCTHQNQRRTSAMSVDLYMPKRLWNFTLFSLIFFFKLNRIGIGHCVALRNTATRIKLCSLLRQRDFPFCYCVFVSWISFFLFVTCSQTLLKWFGRRHGVRAANQMSSRTLVQSKKRKRISATNTNHTNAILSPAFAK